jgi:L-methionine (R)-S-oxide reductase
MRESTITARYDRVYIQLEELLNQTNNTITRMATIAALLHHKMQGFSWTGFYLLKDDKLTVGPYQGPLACQVLEKDKGVCWACINSNRSIIVPDVDAFPGHIACDSRTRSEIVVPIRNENGNIIGVLDIDSREPDHFKDEDLKSLERIVRLI